MKNLLPWIDHLICSFSTGICGPVVGVLPQTVLVVALLVCWALQELWGQTQDSAALLPS